MAMLVPPAVLPLLVPRLVTVGAPVDRYVNSSAPPVVEVPLLVVTVMSTVPAEPAGTMAVMEESLLTVKVALVPPNLTAVVPLKFVPVDVNGHAARGAAGGQVDGGDGGSRSGDVGDRELVGGDDAGSSRRRGHADVLGAGGRGWASAPRWTESEIDVEVGSVDAVDGDGGGTGEVAAQDVQGGAAAGRAGGRGQAGDAGAGGGGVDELVGRAEVLDVPLGVVTVTWKVPAAWDGRTGVMEESLS